jgi:hypothetical protein
MSNLHAMIKSTHVYRILEFEHLLDIFKNRTLRLARPSTWDDPYEATLSHEVFNRVFAQCWSSLPVSDAMWRIYSPKHTGVRIRTTHNQLISQVRAETPGCSSKISKVSYLETVELKTRLREKVSSLEVNFNQLEAIDTLFLKRRAFSYESEVRLVVLSETYKENQKYMDIKINPHILITDIMVDPRASARFFDIVRYYLRMNIKYRGQIRRSSLYSPIEALKIEETNE